MAIRCWMTDIAWERVHVALTATLTGLPAGPHEVRFRIVDLERTFPVETVALGDGTYRLELNVTNFVNRAQIPDGTWRFVADIDGKEGPVAAFDLNDLARLDRDSRNFVYAGNRTSYGITFGISEDDVRPDFLMRAYQMFRSPKSTPGIDKPPLVARFKSKALPRSRRAKALDLVYQAARRRRRTGGKPRLLFASEMRTAIGDNLMRVHDRMIERGLDKQFDFTYSFRAPHAGSKRTTLRLVYLLAQADIVLIDDYFAVLASLNLDPGTKIIQAWHAGSGFKAVGYSRFGNYGSPSLRNAHRKYTYAITGSRHLVPVYAEAFGMEESAVIPTGLPRIDTFLDPQHAAQVAADFATDYPHLAGKQIILFAPTFRGRGTRDAYYDYDKIDFGKLYEVCGDDRVILFRMHHYVHQLVPIPLEYRDRLYDFRAYPNTNDLLQVTDVLITDYSSIIYEFSLLNRPMLFFAYDQDVYAATRGFHRDFDESAPGRICADTDELVLAIRNGDYETWKVEKFRRENFDVIDTNSTDRVIDQLIVSDPRTSEAAQAQDAEVVELDDQDDV